MNESWMIRSYRNGDEYEITKLYYLVFGEKMDLQHWKWRFKDNPAGTLSIVLAEGKNGLVGQYALCPVKMKVGDSTCIGALSLDTMVHPHYRGQGMFVKLAEHLYDSIARLDIPLIYGFPNENSHHGIVVRLNWVDLCNRVPLFARPLNVKRTLSTKVEGRLLLNIVGSLGQAGLSCLSPCKPFELLGECTIQQAMSFDERINRLWEQASSAFNITVVRDRHYLNWRYIEKPENGYIVFTLEKTDDILGYIVLKNMEKFGLQLGFVVDLLAVPDPPDISRCLISKAVEYFKELQSDLVSCLMLKHGPYIHALKENGFLFVPPKFHPQEMYVGVRCNTEEYPAEFITNPDNWHITWGDHDDV